jgi:hypothetical protein
MVKSGMRGGISVISKRYAKANNPYMKSYDETKPSSYIVYLDANGLNAWSMTQYLPVRDFCWDVIGDYERQEQQQNEWFAPSDDVECVEKKSDCEKNCPNENYPMNYYQKSKLS